MLLLNVYHISYCLHILCYQSSSNLHCNTVSGEDYYRPGLHPIPWPMYIYIYINIYIYIYIYIFNNAMCSIMSICEQLYMYICCHKISNKQINKRLSTRGKRGSIWVPFQHRMCTTCNLLEDEYHFVIECQRYNDLRRKYIRPFFYVRPNMFKCLDLIQSTNVSIVKNLPLFVYTAFKGRNNYGFVW